MNTSYTAFDWLLINVANAFKHDKILFEDRIKWAYERVWELPTLARTVDEQKAVLALHSAIRTGKSNCFVMLDASCSGIQILSALTNCSTGATHTGIGIPTVVGDAYTAVQNSMNKRLEGSLNLPRPIVKAAVMTAVYGSKKTPRETFQHISNGYECFQEATLEVAPSAFKLLPGLISTWKPFAEYHSWVLPDGFVCSIRATADVEERVYVEELNSTITVGLEVEMPKEYSVSNAANITHSIDALVLRNMARRCMYDTEHLTHVLDLLIKYRDVPATNEPNHGKQNAIGRIQRSRFIDPSIYLLIEDKYDVLCFPQVLRNIFIERVSQILEYPSFQITCNHDAFGCLPVHCNRMSYWYKEILAELAESTILTDIWNQLGMTGSFTPATNIAPLIRQSIYGIS